jgi:hypothetical protein
MIISTAGDSGIDSRGRDAGTITVDRVVSLMLNVAMSLPPLE